MGLWQCPISPLRFLPLTLPVHTARSALRSGDTRFPAEYEVTYARRLLGRDVSPELLIRLVPAILRADVVHLTATYSFPTIPTLAFCRLFRRPVVWSPRGAIQARLEWVEAENRAKYLFEHAARLLAPSRTILHVTSPTEAELTGRAMPGMKVETIPNSVEIPSVPSTFPRSEPGERALRLMFLSRIHKKKGLELLLGALADIPDTLLDVYGTGTKEYEGNLKQLCTKLNIEKRVKFHGHVDGTAREKAFRSADIFVLPSYSENFGNVVAEALAFGVPVITTTNTPWMELKSKQCGECVASNVDAIKDAIKRMGKADLAAMGRAGRRFVADTFSNEIISCRMSRIYEELVSYS